MTRRRTVRERWMAAVLQGDLNNAAKVVCLALAMQMDDHGRVRYPREHLAADIGIKSLQRVTDRIKEARDAGYLTHTGGGINGTVSQYYAELPGTPPRGTSSTGRGAGSRGITNGVPEPVDNSEPGTPPRGPIRARTPARVTKTQNPHNPTPPAPERGPSRPHLKLVSIDHATTRRAGPIDAPQPATGTDGPTHPSRHRSNP